MADQDKKLHRAKASGNKGLLHRARVKKTGSPDANANALHRAKAADKVQADTTQQSTKRENKNRHSYGSVPEKRPAVRNREFTVIAVFFMAVFVAMAGYLCKFMVADSEDFISSSYNPRLSAMSDSVIKGEIKTSDGVVVAQTATDVEGNEYRTYPQGRVYAHAVGYADNGMSGLEKQADFSLLRSHENIFTKAAKSLSGEKYQGDTVVSTLDSGLQQAAYEGLGYRQGAVIALDPDTGAVLAMVSKPDFDPNTVAANWDSLNSDSTTAVLLNRSTQGLYTPGSTFKIVTALAYLKEHNGSDADFTYTCTGSFTYNDSVIHCAHDAVHGEENLQQAFANSCNCAFAYMALSLDKGEFKETAEELYFNKKLPTKLLNVSKSRFALDENSTEELTQQTAFGQGDTMVTPVQMAMISAAVAGGGTTKQPTLIDHIENDTGTTIRSLLPENTNVTFMDEDEANVLSAYMRSVVTEGTAASLYTDAYTAYGKTGTAEYNSNNDTNAWFTGYAELNGKKIAIAVVVEDASSGGTDAVPIAKSIFDVYFN